jgi:hypothetical protein
MNRRQKIDRFLIEIEDRIQNLSEMEALDYFMWIKTVPKETIINST